MAMNPGAAGDVALALVVSLLAGFGTLQYADVRSSYPPHMTGRAMAVFTMAMFLGVAVMQWFTGAVAGVATAFGVETYAAVLGAIAISLALGALAFKVLPQPQRRPGSIIRPTAKWRLPTRPKNRQTHDRSGFQRVKRCHHENIDHCSSHRAQPCRLRRNDRPGRPDAHRRPGGG